MMILKAKKHRAEDRRNVYMQSAFDECCYTAASRLDYSAIILFFVVSLLRFEIQDDVGRCIVATCKSCGALK